MKKSILFRGLFSFLFFTLALAASAEARQGLNLGASVGGFPLFGGWVAYRFGGEMGYRFADRLGVIAEIGYAKSTQTSESSNVFGSYTSKSTRSSRPITLSLLYFAPFTQGATAYAGFGAGYYFLKYSDQTGMQTLYGSSENTANEWSVGGFAPHVCVGVEVEIGSSIRAFGEARHVIGMVFNEYTTPNGTSYKYDLNFGGAEVRGGVRVIFK